MRKNLSQQKLLEILIAEIELLQQTSKGIKELAPEIERQLHILKTSKLKFDLNTDHLEQLLLNHENQLKKSVLIPKWFLYLILGVLFTSIVNWFV
ncbi:MAG: hypothetical protein N4A74_07250 [Carboxylicivirga sp.]|jgi:hypothetical protein|nr:hypothetical protein [Carboxylicivirga sp.]